MGDRVYTSNLILDRELALEFNRIAYKCVSKLKYKYFSLFQFMSEDDVVMECWDKILSQDIGFRVDVPHKFDSFVWMIVHCKCIDLSRKIRKHNVVTSINSTFSYGDGREFSFENVVQDELSGDMFDSVELYDLWNTFSGDVAVIEYKGVSLQKVILMREEGYSFKEIEEMLGVSSSRISKMLKSFKDVIKGRVFNTGIPLEEILFNEELGYFTSHDKEDFLKMLSFIREEEYGIKLSDIVKLVLEDYSYSEIAKKLSVGNGTVKVFLDKYLGMTF